MKRYSMGFLFSSDLSRVLLIRKAPGTRHADLLNGVGGAVELGEDPPAAMAREFAEEAGWTTPLDWVEYALCRGDDYELHVFRARADFDPEFSHLTSEGCVSAHGVSHLVDYFSDRHHVADLEWLMPMSRRHLQNLGPRHYELWCGAGERPLPLCRACGSKNVLLGTGCPDCGHERHISWCRVYCPSCTSEEISDCGSVRHDGQCGESRPAGSLARSPKPGSEGSDSTVSETRIPLVGSEFGEPSRFAEDHGRTWWWDRPTTREDRDPGVGEVGDQLGSPNSLPAEQISEGEGRGSGAGDRGASPTRRGEVDRERTIEMVHRTITNSRFGRGLCQELVVEIVDAILGANGEPARLPEGGFAKGAQPPPIGGDRGPGSRERGTSPMCRSCDSSPQGIKVPRHQSAKDVILGPMCRACGSTNVLFGNECPMCRECGSTNVLFGNECPDCGSVRHDGQCGESRPAGSLAGSPKPGSEGSDSTVSKGDDELRRLFRSSAYGKRREGDDLLTPENRIPLAGDEVWTASEDRGSGVGEVGDQLVSPDSLPAEKISEGERVAVGSTARSTGEHPVVVGCNAEALSTSAVPAGYAERALIDRIATELRSLRTAAEHSRTRIYMLNQFREAWRDWARKILGLDAGEVTSPEEEARARAKISMRLKKADLPAGVPTSNLDALARDMAEDPTMRMVVGPANMRGEIAVELASFLTARGRPSVMMTYWALSGTLSEAVEKVREELCRRSRPRGEWAHLFKNRG